MMTTGIFLAIADCTAGTNATLSTGASTIPLTLSEANCSTTEIWPARSSSCIDPL